jgi:hypothetical protein
MIPCCYPKEQQTMAKALTAKSVEQIKPDPQRRREVPDGLLTGLYFVVQPSGAKSWAVRYRHGGQPRKLTLGAYPMLELGHARDAARTALQAVSKGEDPAALKKAARAAMPTDRDLIKNVVADFLDRHMKGSKSRPEVERMFKHDVLPAWGERRIQDISKRDVIELLDGLTDRALGRWLTGCSPSSGSCSTGLPNGTLSPHRPVWG